MWSNLIYNGSCKKKARKIEGWYKKYYPNYNKQEEEEGSKDDEGRRDKQ